jgi:hypothetical protein
MYLGVRPSPDESYLLVTRLKRPFSYRVPYFYFARTVEVWDRDMNKRLRVIADLPVSDEVPPQGVPTGPRGVTWQEKKDATLLWTEALDNGDPLAKVPHRDRILSVAAPFTAPAIWLLTRCRAACGASDLSGSATVATEPVAAPLAAPLISPDQHGRD